MINSKQKLAVIGASYLQQPFVEKAKEMGLEIHCFAWEEGAVCKDIADQFYPISIIEKEEILSICQQIGINGICTFGCSFHCCLCSRENGIGWKFIRVCSKSE